MESVYVYTATCFKSGLHKRRQGLQGVHIVGLFTRPTPRSSPQSGLFQTQSSSSCSQTWWQEGVPWGHTTARLLALPLQSKRPRYLSPFPPLQNRVLNKT